MVILKEGAFAFFFTLLHGGLIYIISIALIVIAVILGGKLRARKNNKDNKIETQK